MIIKFKTTPFKDDETPVIEGECYSPTEMFETNQITTNNVERTAVYGNENRTKLEDYERKDMSLNDAWEMEQESKQKLGKFYSDTMTEVNKRKKEEEDNQ